ncbi:MAG TPA: alkaline phosphatase family protein [Pyrinomonadaceae bacterium]
MSRGPRVVVIAIDGTDVETISRHVAAGALPVLTKAIHKAREVNVRSQGDIFLTSTWPCFASGVAVENHGIHAFRPLRSGTLELVEGADLRVPGPFWETATLAGLRSCVVDVPHCAPPPEDAPLEGLRFLEWGSHPPVRPAGSFPPALARTIMDRYGPHPCTNDDQSLKTVRGLKTVRAQLCEGVRLREKIIMDLLDQDPPDLLVTAFSEAHTGGHQFLNLDAPGHTWHDPAVVAALGESPLGLVYETIDASVGRILERLPAETTVLIVCLGGIRVTYGGSQLLEEVLLRMGLTVPSGRKRSPRLWRLLPERLRAALLHRLPALAARRTGARFRSSLDWSKTRAFALPWAYDGYLRVNQRGREPLGIVAPGQERSMLLDQIESAVRELRIVGTDETAVYKLVRAQDVYHGRASEELPDLMVLWKNDRPIDAVESSRLGRINNRDRGRRPAHSTQGVIYAWGPGIAEGAPIRGVRDIDIAPTVLALLGLTPPEGLDGRLIAELLRSRAAAV